MMLECLAISSNLGTHCPDLFSIPTLLYSARASMVIHQTRLNDNHLSDAVESIQKYFVDHRVESSRPT